MPKFRILTPAGLSFSNSGGGYGFEMEALDGLDAEIVECAATKRPSSPWPMPMPSTPRA